MLLSKTGMVKDWHTKFMDIIKGIDASILLESERIFNCDKSGSAVDANTYKVMADIASKYTYQIGSETHTMITVPHGLLQCSGVIHIPDDYIPCNPVPLKMCSKSRF